MKEVTIEEFHKIVENEDDLNILDVRPRELYEEGHVPGAKHFPLSQIEDHLDELDKDKHYYAICHDGKGSKKASEILDENGFDVTNVEKGVPDYPGELEKA
ncbi:MULTISPECIES: rhodanese-like domain-containing protein [Aerococcus]|uniref:Rhodanese-like domain-containing protein n=2 Tax=Aerococcus TaxID=1375 RepID=A0A109REA9_9LACT|nr:MULTISPECIES: rhodanese-like domain-containing protein [Aerococcus]AMB95124.1 rhodanese [Aerococcus urinae]KAA9234748.1 rhodanese-like domain-containing protein [Aerococcus mictus]KAA9290561.1 rhodanese-like domain-containing protein [Aerococcus mictus]KAA9298560.1 rhodanese-like domain-containing protein [Aerococcus tenax]MBU5609538.1 rhodanese-like domain-containing protein [Aerococcus urinae]